MATKLAPGDTIAMQGEVTRINDDNTVTVHLHGFEYPITTCGEHLQLIEKKPGAKNRPAE